MHCEFYTYIASAMAEFLYFKNEYLTYDKLSENGILADLIFNKKQCQPHRIISDVNRICSFQYCNKSISSHLDSSQQETKSFISTPDVSTTKETRNFLQICF